MESRPEPPATDSPDFYAGLCRALAASDMGAFETLFRHLHAPLLRYASSLVGPDAADDVVQDAFVRIWNARERLDPDRSLRALLYQTVRNLAFNRTRDRRLHDEKHVEMSVTVASPPAPDAVTDGARLDDHLGRWIEALPPRQREALTLSRFDGLTHDEIADAMGVSPRTVNNHLVAALKTLRSHLSRYDSTLLAG
ncbi:MAG: RNA polymerase sigma-70 factor [Rubricoccaceae bacterium]|nr:RNA polymerase sigma-70 factor [Rubricoccaceae bacterium]